MERAFKGVWIPSDIWLSKDLTLIEKLFLVEIESLDNENGCYASNAYFAEFFDLSKNRCSEIIKSLEAKNKISIEYEYLKNVIQKRILKVVKGVFEKPNGVLEKSTKGIRKTEEGYSEKCEDNNTIINNTIESKSALDFLIENAPSVYESFEMRFKKQISDFEKFKELFNCKVEEEELEFTTKKINARLTRFAINFIENDNKQFGQQNQTQPNEPAYRKNVI